MWFYSCYSTDFTLWKIIFLSAVMYDICLSDWCKDFCLLFVSDSTHILWKVILCETCSVVKEVNILLCGGIIASKMWSGSIFVLLSLSYILTLTFQILQKTDFWWDLHIPRGLCSTVPALILCLVQCRRVARGQVSLPWNPWAIWKVLEALTV